MSSKLKVTKLWHKLGNSVRQPKLKYCLRKEHCRKIGQISFASLVVDKAIVCSYSKYRVKANFNHLSELLFTAHVDINLLATKRHSRWYLLPRLNNNEKFMTELIEVCSNLSSNYLALANIKTNTNSLVIARCFLYSKGHFRIN